jgi:hypothetical protein
VKLVAENLASRANDEPARGDCAAGKGHDGTPARHVRHSVGHARKASGELCEMSNYVAKIPSHKGF